MPQNYPLPLPGLRLWVNGVDRTATGEVASSTVAIHHILGQQVDTATFRLIPPGTWRAVGGSQPQVGQAVLIEIQNGASQIPSVPGAPFNGDFGGSISAVNEIKLAPGRVAWDVSCVDYTNLLARVLVNTNYVGWTVSAIVKDVCRKYAPTIVIDANVQDALNVIDNIAFAYMYPLAILQQLSTLVGFDFYVDAYKVLHFYDASLQTQASSQGITISGSLGQFSSRNFDHLSIEPQIDQVRNRIYVQGGAALSLPTQEQYDADGVKVVFPLKHDNVSTYQLGISGLTPFMAINGVAQTVALEGTVNETDLGAIGGFFLKPGTGAEVWTPAGTATVADGSRIIFAYQWAVPIATVRESAASENAVAVLEGTDYATVVLDDNPIFYYRLDEAPLAGSFQPVPYAVNYGTASVTPQYLEYYQGAITQGVPGALRADPDLAADFRGGGSMLGASGVRIPPAAQGTLEAWVRVPTVQTGSFLPDGSLAYREGGLVGQWDTTLPHRGAFLWLCSGGTYALGYGSSVATDHLIPHTASGVPTGTDWDHVVATWQLVAGTHVRNLYVNNSVVISDSSVIVRGSVPGSGIEIANYNYGLNLNANSPQGRNPLYGAVDEVAIYDYALSGSQVADHYASGKWAGVRDYVVNDTTLTTIDLAHKRGDVELARWSNVITNVTFDSYVPGWRIGDSVSVNVSSTTGGHNFSGTALIQELEIRFEGAQRAQYLARCQAQRFNFLDYQKKLLGIGNQAIQQNSASALDTIEAYETNPITTIASVSSTVNTPPFLVAPDWGTGTTPYGVVGFSVVDPTLY